MSGKDEPHLVLVAGGQEAGPISPERAAELLHQLALARAAFREEQQAASQAMAEERQRLDSRRKQTRELQAAAKKERARVKSLYSRYLKRMKSQWSSHQQQVEEERQQLLRMRDTLVAEAEHLAQIRQRFSADAEAYKSRLYSAWELLHDSQRRLLADRQEAEAWIGRQTVQLDARAAELNAQELRQLPRPQVEPVRIAMLAEELQGLEARVEHTRTVLAELEQKREEASAAASAIAAPRLIETGFAPRKGSPSASDNMAEADRLLFELREGEAELNRERNRLQADQQALEQKSRELADERTILTEQAEALAAARGIWHTAEQHTIDELESLTREVRARELAAEERERDLLAADRQRRTQSYEAWQLQGKLEAWQTMLIEQEVAVRTAREQQDAEMDRRREVLLTRESSLDSVVLTWARLREHERAQLHGEIERWASARQHYESRLIELDQAREHFLVEAQRAASDQLAHAEYANEEAKRSTGKHDERRFQILRKKWERHFEQYRKDLERRRAEAQKEIRIASVRLTELQEGLEQLAVRYGELTESQTRIDLERIAALRTEDKQPLALAGACAEKIPASAPESSY